MENLSFNELKNKLDEITIRYEMLNISQSVLNSEEIIKGILNYLKQFFMFKALSFYPRKGKDKKFNPYRTSEILFQELIQDNDLINSVSDKREILILSEGMKDQTLFKILAPINDGGKSIGVLIGLREKPFLKDEISLFKIAAKQFAFIIQNVKAEERYRSVVENALDGVVVLDEDGRVLYVNEKMTELIGYQKEELIGKYFSQFIDEDGKKVLKNNIPQRIDEEEVSLWYELNIIKRNGEIRNVEVSATCIRDTEENPVIVAFIKDITEKKKFEIQLIQSEKLRAIAEMANGMAHDFNNALSIILGNIQLLKLNVSDINILTTLNLIEKVAKDSAQTIKRLHDFTKHTPRKDLQQLNINSIVEDAILITKPKWKNDAQRKGINIDIICDLKDIPPVMGNPSEMREVLTNIIFNAVEAMPEGGKIEIKTFWNKGKNYIKILDTGIGMCEEVRKRIFEPFFTTKPFTNSGLGLSMCYGIIKSFGGDIEVESKLGGATTFTIILPIGESSKEINNIRNKDSKSEKRARILVIEDEELVRDILYKGLSFAHHQVTVAKNGSEGIEIFQNNVFDIVLTDLGMPNLSGWDICKVIKEMSPNTPVGIITGWKVEIDEKENEGKMPDFIISKPFDFNEILNKINELLMEH